MMPLEFCPGRLCPWDVFPDGPGDVPRITDSVTGERHGCQPHPSRRTPWLPSSLPLSTQPVFPRAEHCTSRAPWRLRKLRSCLPSGCRAYLALSEAPRGGVTTHSINFTSEVLSTSPPGTSFDLLTFAVTVQQRTTDASCVPGLSG